MSIINDIKNYWSVQPPFKAQGKVGTPAWSRSITAHRHQVVPYLKNFMEAPDYAGKNVLEIGIGAGSDLLEFKKAGCSVQGVDVTKTAIELTKNRFIVEGLGKPELKQYDGKSLPYADNTFDLVYSHGVLHHTPYMDDLLGEAWRVLKPGGALSMMVYSRDSLLYYYLIYYWRHVKKQKISRQELLSKYSEFRTGCPYTRAYTEGEIRDHLMFFPRVAVTAQYLVYDDYPTGRRKVSGREFFKHKIEYTGMPDVDKFFTQFFVCRELPESELTWAAGWHLLIHATK